MATFKNPCRTCARRFQMLLSIVSPCDRCEYNEFNSIFSFSDDSYQYTTTTQTDTSLHFTTKSDTDVTKEEETLSFQKGLPTRDEYAEELNSFKHAFVEWSEPKYICPKCGGNMRRNEVRVLTSNPPKRLYQCDKCAFTEFLPV